MLSSEQIQRLWTWVPETARENEARRSARIPHAANLMITLAGQNGGRSVEVRVRDLSNRGIGLTAPVAIRPGETFVSHFVSKDTRKPMYVACTSRYCRALPGKRFAIGAEFNVEVERGSGADSAGAIGKPPTAKAG